MPVFHVVTYSLHCDSEPWGLVRAMNAVIEDARLNGNKYIRSLKGGKQHSPLGIAADMEVVFVLEFECEADRDYWVYTDPAHKTFKKVEQWVGVKDKLVFDFTQDEY